MTCDLVAAHIVLHPLLRTLFAGTDQSLPINGSLPLNKRSCNKRSCNHADLGTDDVEGIDGMSKVDGLKTREARRFAPVLKQV